MAVVHKERNRQGELADLLGMSLGQGLSGMANDYYANKAINKVMEDKSLENAPIEKKFSKLEEALRPFGERGQKILENKFAIEAEGRKVRESEAKIKQEKLKKIEEEKVSKNLEEFLIKAGMDPKDAKVAAASGAGTQTALINDFINKRNREDKIEEKVGNLEENEKYPLQVLPSGMNAKEKVEYKANLRKENVPIYQGVVEKMKALKAEKALISRATFLNDNGNLPEGLERYIINPETGEPYGLAQLAGLVNEDTQSFIKTINEFTTKAKDTYGSRVTNFDLQQYMKRLPGLLNTPAGRKNILKQMEISNKITELYESELERIYNHYGLDGISQERAHAMASKNIANEEAQLLEQFRTIDESNQSMSKNGGKTRFDVNNPQHAKRRQEILEKVKGNKKEANRLLAEEFVK